MVAKRSSRALALLLVLPSAAFAFGLGDIRLLSPLNAPLDAEIDLVDVTPEELGSLKAQIAPRELFAQHGLDWPVFLSSVQVRTQRAVDGHQIIKLKSTETVTEPFITLLVEVDWARGRQVREYTMLLDPPVYTPNPGAQSPVVAAASGAGAHEGAIARATPAPPAPVTAAAATAAPAPRSAPGPRSSGAAAAVNSNPTHVVQRGETLSQIATSASGSSANSGQTRSWMLAIYQANPRAFDQNMNLMRSGAVLRIPDAAVVAAIAASDASTEIRRQYAAWRGTTPAANAAAAEPGHLRLVSPAQTGTATETEGQVKTLQGRVHDLEGQLSESKRLLELRNAQLAELQSKLAARQTDGTAAAAASPESPPVPAPATEAAPVTTPPPAVAQTEAPPAAVAAPAAAPPAPKKLPASAPAASQPGPSMLDRVVEYGWALAALVIAILAFFGLKAWRSRRQSEFDDSLGRLAVAGVESGGRPVAVPEVAVSRNTPASAKEDAFLVEESGTHERPKFGAASPASAARHVDSRDDSISGDAAIQLDQGDPLAEADFHMAYGLYDQAADLIRIAISREPARRDLKLKLLEVFFVWGNKDQFLQSARELAESRAEAAPGEWEKIVIMGKQLAPEDPLFSAASGWSGASAGGVDLDLEGGQSRVDFDILGEPVPGEDLGGVDLDIGSALGEATGNSKSLGGATDRNAAIDHSFSGTTGTTRQMTAKMPHDAQSLMADFPSDPEAPTVEQPAITSLENPTIRQKVEIAMRQNAVEQTAELAIDDLGLEVGSLDTVDQPGLGSSPDAPTMVAGLDDHSRRMLDDAQRRGGPNTPSETGTWHMDEGELDAALAVRDGRGAGNGHDPAATAQIANSELDFDLGAAEEASHPSDGNGLDLDVGTATVPDAAFASTQRLSSDDLALPDLEPVTLSEVGTKLDLARAYMDMGDPDGARNILEEVLTEGSSTQQQEAKRLMESLPG